MDVTRLSAEQAAQEVKIKERTLKMVTFDVCLEVINAKHVKGTM